MDPSNRTQGVSADSILVGEKLRGEVLENLNLKSGAVAARDFPAKTLLASPNTIL